MEEKTFCTWRSALCLFCIHCEEKIDPDEPVQHPFEAKPKRKGLLNDTVLMPQGSFAVEGLPFLADDLVDGLLTAHPWI
ncbi:hypothetical protein [Rhizobium cremeum]|uniref:hypothetical protein n=1 Tax=Rhizobium cremeum TaxID=2813827 RepID=UPI000DE3EFBA